MLIYMNIYIYIIHNYIYNGKPHPNNPRKAHCTHGAQRPLPDTTTRRASAQVCGHLSKVCGSSVKHILLACQPQAVFWG